MSRIAAIIPCLNEEQHLPGTLEALQTAFAAAKMQAELIVVDGGSSDASIDLANSRACRVILSDRKQRAHQLNLGARSTDADILWFVHADTRVPIAAVRNLRLAMRVPALVGGGFCRRFDSDSLYLRWACRVADLRGRWWKYFYGDQAMFARRLAYEHLGGFDESLDVAEDLDFSLRLRAIGKIATLTPPVIGSARRFEALGPRIQVRNDRKFVKHWMRDHGQRHWPR